MNALRKLHLVASAIVVVVSVLAPEAWKELRR